jgi:hypothetical protein
MAVSSGQGTSGPSISVLSASAAAPPQALPLPAALLLLETPAPQLPAGSSSAWLLPLPAPRLAPARDWVPATAQLAEQRLSELAKSRCRLYANHLQLPPLPLLLMRLVRTPFRAPIDWLQVLVRELEAADCGVVPLRQLRHSMVGPVSGCPVERLWSRGVCFNRSLSAS